MLGLTIAGFLYGYQFGLDEKISLSTQAVDLNKVSSTTNQSLEQKYIEDGVVSYKAQPGDVVRDTKYIVKNQNLYYLADSEEPLRETLLVEGVTYVAAFGDNVVHANEKLFAKDQLIEDTVVLKDLNGYGNRLVSDTKIYLIDGDMLSVMYEGVSGANVKLVPEFGDEGLSPLADGGYWPYIFTDGKSVYCLRSSDGKPRSPISEPVEIIFTEVKDSDVYAPRITVNGVEHAKWFKGSVRTEDALVGYVTLSQKTSGEKYNTQCDKI